MKITITPTLRRYLDGMDVKRLPRGLKWAEVEIERLHAATQHPEENAEEHLARAIARVAHRMGTQSVTRSLKRFVRDWRVLWVMIAVLILLLLDSQLGHSQETRVRGAVKGTTTSAPVTATSTDANHTGLDVNCVSGCSGSSSGTASSVSVADGTTSTQKLAVDAAGKIAINNHPAFQFDGSGNLKTALQNTNIAVTGTFWQSVQPVSGTVSVSNFPATQPVSGAVTVSQGTGTNLHIVCDSGCSGSSGGSNTPTDAFANPTNASPAQSFLMGWNGLTWDRIITEGTGNDGESSKTTGALEAETHGMVFNGTSWDRVRGDATSGAWVQLKAAIPAGANLIGGVNVSQFGGSAVATGTGTGGVGVPRVTISSDSVHPVTVNAGSAIVGKVGIDQTTPGTTNAVEITGSTDSSIGLTATSKATVTSSVSVKTSAGNLYGVFIMNGAVATCWLELINSASAGTLGTGVIMNIPMANAAVQYLQFNPPIGGFTSGIAVGSASAVGGSTACGTAATGVTLIYK